MGGRCVIYEHPMEQRVAEVAGEAHRLIEDTAYRSASSLALS